MNYFNKLPTINYDGFSAKNLLARAVLSDSTKNNNSIFYPYTIQSDDGRIDNLSRNYYDNPGYSWLIWHTNNIIDPYYGTPLTDEDLYEVIVAKYGSFSDAERKIAYYRINWESDPRVISIAQFDNLLESEKKYWDPQLNSNIQISGYVRKKETRIVNTNKIVNIVYQLLTPTPFVNEEKVSYDTSTSGWVSSSDANSLLLENITGEFTVGTIIEGETSGARATITSTSIVSQTSAGENPLYWEPVSFAQFEQEENERKRDIVLLDVRYKSQVENELKRVMSAT